MKAPTWMKKFPLPGFELTVWEVVLALALLPVGEADSCFLVSVAGLVVPGPEGVETGPWLSPGFISVEDFSAWAETGGEEGTEAGSETAAEAGSEVVAEAGEGCSPVVFSSAGTTGVGETTVSALFWLSSVLPINSDCFLPT